MKHSSATRIIVSVLTWGIYFLALALPALDVPETRGSEGHGRFAGYVALLMGWIPPFCVPWRANLLLLGGCMAYARGCSFVAFGPGLAATARALPTRIFF